MAISKNPPDAVAQKKPDPFPGERARQWRRYTERAALAVTVLGCLALVSVIWYSDGKVLDSSIKYLQSFESKDAQSSRSYAQNCKDPRNSNTVYCQERTGRTESDWKAMSRSQGGKSSQYTLHGH